MLPAQPNQSLIDGLACLQALAVASGPVGVRELARRLGLETTRVHRLVKTLAHLGIAQQQADRRYAPGPGMHVLSAQSLLASGLIRRAIPMLASLNPLGHRVALGVLWRGQVCYLYHGGPGVEPAESLGRVGLFPAVRSSIGLVLLAAMPQAQVAALWEAGELAGRFRSLDALRKELAKVQRQGWALVDHAEPQPHASLGICVGNPPMAGLALAGTFTARDHEHLLSRLRQAAVRIDEPHAPSASVPSPSESSRRSTRRPTKGKSS